MLLDPAKQEFDLPAALVESRDFDCRAFEIIGDERDHSAFVPPDLDASQRDRQLGIALAGEDDIGIGNDSESVACGLTPVPGLGLAQARVHLHARDEESVGSVDLLPPAKVIIALVENVGRAAFELGLTADLNVVDGRGRNLDATGDIVPRMIDDVHFMPRIRPFHSAHLHILPNGTGLESINRIISDPSTRVCRSAFFASMAKVSAKTPTGRRAFARESVERGALPMPK